MRELILLKVITVICHYWFFNHRFNFRDSVCNFCFDLATLSLNISNIAIIDVRAIDYHCTIQYISKSETNRLLENYVVDYRG